MSRPPNDPREASELAIKIANFLDSTPGAAAKLALMCGVTRQAVTGWKRPGAISRTNMAHLVVLSGRPLEWWTGASRTQDDKSAQALQLFDAWRWLLPSQQDELLAQISALAEINRAAAQQFSGRLDVTKLPGTVTQLLNATPVRQTRAKKRLPATPLDTLFKAKLKKGRT